MKNSILMGPNPNMAFERDAPKAKRKIIPEFGRREMNSLIFSFADISKSEPIKRLLAECDLSTDDVSDHWDHFIVAEDGKTLAGVIGLEPLASLGLLRSLAVAKPYRGHGLARALCNRMDAYARQQGIDELYLLTTTAADFFLKLGLACMTRRIL